MKIKKTTQPATFQPVVLTITIEDVDELEYLNELYMQSTYVRISTTQTETLSHESAYFLELLLDAIGEALYKAPEGT